MFSRIIHNTNKYGGSVSTQDWIKFLAILTMTIDHIGHYFLIGEESYGWFRTIGRIHVPIWFFFAGYAGTHKISRELLGWACFLLLIGLIGYRGLLPLNIFFTIMICRVAVHGCRKYGWTDKRPFDIFVLCLFLSLFTDMFWEYGTTAVLFAIMGDMVRRGKTGIRNQIFFVATFILFMLYQYLGVQPDIWQTLVMTGGVGYYTWRLSRFKQKTIVWFDRHQTFGWWVRLLGRNTLYYYVAHRTIFILLSYYGGFYRPESFPILNLWGL
jgi:hypothetical protein